MANNCPVLVPLIIVQCYIYSFSIWFESSSNTHAQRDTENCLFGLDLSDANRQVNLGLSNLSFVVKLQYQLSILQVNHCLRRHHQKNREQFDIWTVFFRNLFIFQYYCDAMIFYLKKNCLEPKPIVNRLILKQLLSFQIWFFFFGKEKMNFGFFFFVGSQPASPSIETTYCLLMTNQTNQCFVKSSLNQKEQT